MHYVTTIGNFSTGSLLKVIIKGKKTPNLDYVIHGWSLTYLYGSMTSLLPHTFAQPTKRRFLPKNLSQLDIFVIEHALT